MITPSFYFIFLLSTAFKVWDNCRRRLHFDSFLFWMIRSNIYHGNNKRNGEIWGGGYARGHVNNYVNICSVIYTQGFPDAREPLKMPAAKQLILTTEVDSYGPCASIARHPLCILLDAYPSPSAFVGGVFTSFFASAYACQSRQNLPEFRGLPKQNSLEFPGRMTHAWWPRLWNPRSNDTWSFLPRNLSERKTFSYPKTTFFKNIYLVIGKGISERNMSCCMSLNFICLKNTLKITR